jgi:alkane 1-monooxygenase
MTDNSKEVHQGWGFTLALAPIALMWIDLQFSFAFLLVTLFFVVLPGIRIICPIDYKPLGLNVPLSKKLEIVLIGLPLVFSGLWIGSMLLIPIIAPLVRSNSMATFLAFLSVWVASSLTLPCLHELIHRRNPLHVFVGRVLGAMGGIFYFVEEHKSHHILSGGGHDHDAALEHENVYQHALAAQVHGFTLAWEWELAAQVRGNRSAFSNRIIWTGTITLSMLAWFTFWQGIVGFVFYVLLVVSTNFSLRAITYIQHWGLRTVPLSKGDVAVSWVSNCIFQSWIIFNLALHNDHHQHINRPYYALRSSPEQISLPVTYPLAFLLCLFPFYYKRFMQKRLNQWLELHDKGEIANQRENCLNPR